MSRRRLASVLCLALVVPALAGCGKSTETEDKLRAAIRRTERLAHRFVYAESAGGREAMVQGLVEDDLRYKARVAYGETSVLDEVVSDDALAVRFLEPGHLADFVRRPKKADKGGTGVGANQPAAGDTGTSSGPKAVDPKVLEALRGRHWVLDKAGAPPVFTPPTERRLLGDDLVLDSLSVFAYVERAIDEATRIVVFNPESLEYRADEDPFPKPQKGSGVIRYDFERPKLPRAADTSPGGNQITPDTRHFRKMSVYVKGDRVIAVREAVDVESRLKDLSEIYETKFPKDRKPAELAVIAVDALNAIRRGQGEDPIRLRTMSYELKDLGGAVKVDMPGDVIEAPLAVLENRGRPADVTAGAVLAAAVRSAVAPPAPSPSG
jgi:hypothetical protein